MIQWPRLTEQLCFLTRWGSCQRCRRPFKPLSNAQIWREHDDADQPEPRAVVLCRKCAEVIIEKHPRLYSQERNGVPLPGVMALCDGCDSWKDYGCTHPDLKLNGGEGLKITFPQPTQAHVNRGRGKSGFMTWWNGPPTKCAGQELQE